MAAAERRKKKAEAENPSKARLDFSTSVGGARSAAVKKNTIAESFLKASSKTSKAKKKEVDDELDGLLNENLLEDDEADDENAKRQSSTSQKSGVSGVTRATTGGGAAKASTSTSTSPKRSGGASASKSKSPTNGKAKRSSTAALEAKKSKEGGGKVAHSEEDDNDDAAGHGSREPVQPSSSSSPHMDVDGSEAATVEPSEEELAELELLMQVERSIHEGDEPTTTSRSASTNAATTTSGAIGGKNKTSAKASAAASAKYAPLDVSVMTDDSVLIEDDDDGHEYLGSDYLKLSSMIAPGAATCSSPFSSSSSSSGLMHPSSSSLKMQGGVVRDLSPLLDANGHLLVYWIDAHEESYARPGFVFVFGYVWNEKEKTFQSICISVENLQRTLHFFPKPGCTTEDVRKELDERRKQFGIKQFLSKPVQKYYAFEVEVVPRGVHTFLEVLYPFSDPAMGGTGGGSGGSKLEGETFAHVFGTSRTALETLLLESKLMGPGWIVIKNPILSKAPATWCAYECRLGDSENLVVARFPSSGSTSAATTAASSSSHSSSTTTTSTTTTTSRMDVSSAVASAVSAAGVVANISFEMPPTPKLRVLSLKVQVLHDHQTKQNEILAVSGFERWQYDVERATQVEELFPSPHCRTWTIMRQVGGVSQAVGLEGMLKKNPNMRMENSEKALLNHLMAQIGEYDPDVLVSHSLTSFDMDLLLHRLQHHKCTMFSKLGRLHKTKLPRLKSGDGAGGSGETSLYAMREATAGRLLCDTYTAASEFLRSQKNYKLTTLASSQLDVKRREYSQATIVDMLTNIGTLKELSDHMLNDAFITLQLVAKLDVLPLTRQLTELGGNLWSRSLTGARAERIEYLLMHKFYEVKANVLVPQGEEEEAAAGGGGGSTPAEIKTKSVSVGYIIPDKSKSSDHIVYSNGGDASSSSAAESGVVKKSKKSKNVPAYKGGLVLAPKSGLYEQFTLLLDFNSLYPSLIQEYNVCFTTIERKRGPSGDWLPSDPPDAAVPRGVLPTTIRDLVDKRKQVKQRLASETDATKKKQLDVRQLAIKLVANSMYGCLGFKNSRFFAMPLAELITRKGREALTKAKEIADGMNMDVIYGDTDSIMINTKTNEYKDVKAMGVELKKKINKSFNELEIDIDGIFKSLLLLQKKKYAAMVCGAVKADGSVEVTRQEKGLDLVRRDWCNLASQLGRDILSCIFDESGQRAKEGMEVLEGVQELLRKRAEDVRQGKVKVEEFIITKSMTKKPEDYPDAQSQPHVQVALAMRREGKYVMVGEMIQYVICVLPTSTTANITNNTSTTTATSNSNTMSLAVRARHPDVVKRDNLQIDYTWYLTHQVHPSAARLCEHIEGLDSIAIAELLGLDAAAFKRSQANGSTSSYDVNMPSSSQQSLETRFKECERWRVMCRKCGVPFSFDGMLAKHSLPLPSSSASSSSSSSSSSSPSPLVDAFFSGCRCPSEACGAWQDDDYLKNRLTLELRRFQTSQYASSFVCTGCGKRTRQPVFRGRSSSKVICTCSQADEMVLESNPRQLYNQLLFMQYTFDAQDAMKRLGIDEIGTSSSTSSDPNACHTITSSPMFTVISDLFAMTQRAIQQNRYAIMDCSSIFFMFSSSPQTLITTSTNANAATAVIVPDSYEDDDEDFN